MSIHNKLFSSQDTLLRTASIHDTPSEKDAPDPIAIDHVSLHDIEELEADKVYEPNPEVLRSASIKDDLDIADQVEAIFQAHERSEEKRRRRQFGKANKSKQQRRRDAKKSRQKQLELSKKSSKNKWRAKTLRMDWKYLAQQPGWKNLSRRDKEQLMIFYPARHETCSYEEIATHLGISRNSAVSRIRTWTKNEDLEKRNEYLRNRVGRGKRVGELSSIHARNHYQLTKKRKQEFEEIIKKLCSKKDEKGGFDTRKDSSKEENFCQADLSDRDLSTEEKKGFTLEGKDYHKYLEEQLLKLESKQEGISKEKATIFELYNLQTRAYQEFAPWLKKLINKLPIKLLIRLLKWIGAKLIKGYRIKHFGKFFWWLLKNKIPVPWLKKRTEDYFSAITNKTTLGGVDSDAVIEHILEMEKRTAQKITKKELHGLLTQHGVQHLRASLKFTVFRSNHLKFKLRNWVNFVYFVAKKPIIEILKMFKSDFAKSEKVA
uniref:Uncharacterized protein n=1 Tax=Candidatus Kentrum sp. SD TaxID=2126332 RepID=A0A450YNS5_9GAMM|nr:MAG: hypothetical protein BECKSD772F_GA0070984_11393 [Candidatus Kentron sp. SD]VFK48808.1 MAG: hypothetical protein BECKSD772E_GA0070983_11433 [Candidatus Kentron sp. SD]VFK80624.1 MAG: hypothetical protein BECKSD772D_GA0070982_11343 [Candidatus Kentron sp. SD]